MSDADPGLAGLGAAEAARRIHDGEITAEALVEACLAVIAAREDEVRAWAFLDRDHALAQAKRADAAHRSGVDLGPLHGVPVGIKDVFDTRDMPTECGTLLHAGRKPEQDAAAVALLRAAGAVILGKTVTTELAVYTPGETRNPHDPSRTPGGSSSGSAAAVAAGMVPLAVGSQTNGSVIRPASYCGVFGFKPSFGTISRHGALAQSRPLDTVGLFARSIADIALATEALAVYDQRDPDMQPMAQRRLSAVAGSEPPMTPTLALVRGPQWHEAEADLAGGFAELSEALGETCEEVALPETFDRANDWHRSVMYADLAKSYQPLYERGGDRLSAKLREMIEEGQRVLALDYNRALDWREILNLGLERIFDRFDAIVTPATAGQAPAGLESTGSPAFCTLWTFCGLPAISLPLLSGADGLPIGVQLVGRRGDDARLLRTARWLVATLSET